MSTITHPTANAAPAVAPPSSRAVVAEGVRTGLWAALVVALVFFIPDVLTGAAMHTPLVLGRAVAWLLGLDAIAASAPATVAFYTLLHVAAFAAVGVTAAHVTRLARRDASVLAGALLLFVVLEVAFTGALAVLQATTVTGMLEWPEIAAGNVAGALTVGYRMWRAHPELRGELDEALGGSAA